MLNVKMYTEADFVSAISNSPTNARKKFVRPALLVSGGHAMILHTNKKHSEFDYELLTFVLRKMTNKLTVCSEDVSVVQRERVYLEGKDHSKSVKYYLNRGVFPKFIVGRDENEYNSVLMYIARRKMGNHDAPIYIFPKYLDSWKALSHLKKKKFPTLHYKDEVKVIQTYTSKYIGGFLFSSGLRCLSVIMEKDSASCVMTHLALLSYGMADATCQEVAIDNLCYNTADVTELARMYGLEQISDIKLDDWERVAKKYDIKYTSVNTEEVDVTAHEMLKNSCFGWIFDDVVITKTGLSYTSEVWSVPNDLDKKKIEDRKEDILNQVQLDAMSLELFTDDGNVFSVSTSNDVFMDPHWFYEAS